MNEPEGGGGGWEVPKAEGIALLERGQSEDAVERLRDAASGDPTGETHALLALAHFHRERYSPAADCYTKALAADGDQPELGPHRATSMGSLLARAL